MVDNSNASLIQRGIDDALACQDMLARVPAPPSLLARLRGRLATAVSALMSRWPGPRPTRAHPASLELTR
jgi:hypothetical protein